MFLRAWRLEAVKNRRKEFAKDVTGIMVGFLMSSLGASYIQHQEDERRKELHRNRVPLLLALYCWYALCSHKDSTSCIKRGIGAKPSGNGGNKLGTEIPRRKNHSTSYMRKNLKVRLRFRILSCSADLLVVCWWDVVRKMALALRKAQTRVSLGHIRK